MVVDELPGGMVALVTLVVVMVGHAQAQEGPGDKPVISDPSDFPGGGDCYAQGGVVVDGIAYFTADQSFSRHWKADDFPFAVAFDLARGQRIRTYPFRDTYDSSPLVIQRRDGSWIVLAHEYQNRRTVALERDTGAVAWISPDNQPGSYFFGYSYFARADGSKLVLVASTNGLHAISAETGEEAWWLQRPTTGGVTPCVDQGAGVVYYQRDGEIMKLRAEDGAVLASASVSAPNQTISWNTVLVDDAHGKFIATYWFGLKGGLGESGMQWNAALRVFDPDLRLVWERVHLPGPKKSTLTYAQGKLVIGTGGHWAGRYEGEAWKYLVAYDVATGDEAWRCDLRAHDFDFIMNAPYAWGSFYAETSGRRSRLLRIDAATGELLDVLDYGAPVSSCAQPIIARGLMLSGDLTRDGVVVTRLAEGSTAEWPGPFCDPQTNTYALPDEPGARPVRMVELRPGR